MQLDALQRQRDFVYSQLDPTKLGPIAAAQDAQNAQNRLALQATTDPNELATRYKAEAGISSQVENLGAGSLATQVGNVAAAQGVAGVAGMPAGQKAMVDAAMKELDAGATLPPDVQAQLTQAGLQRVGQSTGGTEPGGNPLIGSVLGMGGVELQAQRQQQAQGLLGSAQQLEQSRQNILGNLFPNLSTVQLNQLQGSQSALQQANNMLPAAGLSGNDVMNLYLTRVGATNQLAQQSANIGAAGGIGAAQAWQAGFGNAINFGSQAFGGNTRASGGVTNNYYGGGSNLADNSGNNNMP